MNQGQLNRSTAATAGVTMTAHGVNAGDRNAPRCSSMTPIARAARALITGVLAIYLYAPSAALALDCNSNGIDDAIDISGGTSLDCNSNSVPDGCDIQTLTSSQNVITTAPDYLDSFYAADLDGDGDIDVLSTSRNDDTIAWYENLNGLGTFGPQRVIATNLVDPHSVFTSDLDGDGDADVLSASHDGPDDRVVWYENTDGLGTFGPQHVITFAVDRPGAVYAADLDGDGDSDVLTTSVNDDEVIWLQNNGGLGTSWIRRVIATEMNAPYLIVAADVDHDADFDILTSSIDGSSIVWFENLISEAGGGTDGFGEEQPISTSADIIGSFSVADLDGDDDLDLVTPAATQRIVWHENTDGMGAFGPQKVITTSGRSAAVIAADFDGDGDNDLLTGVIVLGEFDEVSWHENIDGMGNFGPEQVISTLVSDIRLVLAADIDGDGDNDALSASRADDKIAWYACETFNDCNGSGIPDDCELVGNDCNSNGIPDECDIANLTSVDCNFNGVPDNCEITSGVSPDCNENGIPDDCEIDTFFLDQQVLPSTTDSATSVFATDIDNDGDFDVIASAFPNDTVAWFENTDGLGAFGAQHNITTNAIGAALVFGADLDGDGDTDVLSASNNDNTIAWYENTDGLGGFGPQQVISTTAQGAFSVFAADIDNDEDLDVLSASQFDDKIAWYENTDGFGNFGSEQIITTTADFARSVFAADLDGDGDIDVLSASLADNTIAWYENIGLGAFGLENVISTTAKGAFSVFAADLDGDGDSDVLSASALDDKIAWYENTDGLGTFGAQQTITNSADTAVAVSAADLDGDGDTDVLSTSIEDDTIAWYENVDGLGNFEFKHVISTDADGPVSVSTADINGDGNLDVVSASTYDAKFGWYENRNLNDCNNNANLDECDIIEFKSTDCNNNSVPDDCEGDAYADYFADLVACLDGPSGGLDTGCECFDSDGDGDNDLLDFAEFQRIFNP